MLGLNLLVVSTDRSNNGSNRRERKEGGTDIDDHVDDVTLLRRLLHSMISLEQ